MKLFQRLLVAPAALGLLAPLVANATEVNLDAISNYSGEQPELDLNSFKSFSAEKSLLISGGEGLVDDYDSCFIRICSFCILFDVDEWSDCHSIIYWI